MSRRAAIAMLVAGALALGGARSAVALNHVAALHSGRLVIVLPSSPLFALPSNRHLAVLPVLLGNVDPYRQESRVAAMKQLQPAASAALLKPYVEQIRALPLKAAFLDFGRKAAARVAWIGRDSTVGLHRYFPLTDADTARALGQAGHKDATVFIRPVLVFSSDFRRLYVVAPVIVYASGPVQAFFMDSTTLRAGTSIGQTSPALKTRGVEALAAGNGEALPAIEARAHVWFAHGAARLKQALAADLAKLEKPLWRFLSGP